MKENYGWHPEAGYFTWDGTYLFQHVNGETRVYGWDYQKQAYKRIEETKKPTD